MTVRRRLEHGDTTRSKAMAPIIELVEGPGGVYVWIGNDEDDSKFCFGTLADSKLKSFCLSALIALDRVEAKRKRAS